MAARPFSDQDAGAAGDDVQALGDVFDSLTRAQANLFELSSRIDEDAFGQLREGSGEPRVVDPPKLQRKGQVERGDFYHAVDELQINLGRH